MINTVIFDMDGVIIDSEPFHVKAEQELFKELGIIVSKEEHNSYVGTSSRNMWQFIQNKYQLKNTVEELINRVDIIYMKCMQREMDIKPIEGVVPFILNLFSNNVQLILASSSSKKGISTVLEQFNLRNYFAHIVSGDDVANSKPSPDIFLRASEMGQVMPENCVVIEDSKNGITAAKSAGMKCIGYYNPNSGKQDLSMADRIIKSFSEINYESILKLQNI